MRISVRWSNDIRIEIRKFLRARDNLRISSGYNAASPDSPTRRHTRRQRVGVQSNFRRRKKLHTRGHPSYPSFYSRSGALSSTTGRPNSGGNWPEFQFEIRPKP
ncbi:hypothetical protein L3X38_026173 [Prunus dulcis]|uniref:Uncharacterized protein n=1 Tax=Prunus dulcis TaxID=3755 RepID=A0AAD4Z838_PRUDU|nr:hypothetical protein L3X38_026173 [Prunus dulcis]